MVVLAGHGAETTDLPEKPLQRRFTSADVVRQKLPRLLSEIKQYGPGLENRNGRTAVRGGLINDGRHAIIRTDREEFRFELISLRDVDWQYLVVEPALFEKERNLVSVRGRPIKQLNHFNQRPMT